MPCISPCGSYVAYHAPKTGGTWLSKVWATNGGRRIGGGHDPLRDDNTTPDVATVATVRNPWDWYVSWYLHCLRGGKDMRKSLAWYGGGSTEFKSVLRGATRFAPLSLGVIWSPGRPSRPNKGCGRATYKAMQEVDPTYWHSGLYTFLMNYIYEGNPGLWVATDNLTRAVEDLTPGLDLPPPLNVRHVSAEEVGAVHDDDTIRWIAQADAAWIAWGGWLPGQRSPWVTRSR